MARVVCVHGVGKQHMGERQLLKEWVPAIQDGLTRARAGGRLRDDEIGMAFYGDLFRVAGGTMAVGDPPYTARDVEAGPEEELLLAWWAGAAALDPGVPDPREPSMARAPSTVQAALLALARSPFFAGIAQRAMIYDLKQVVRYLNDDDLRARAQERLRALIGPETQVVVAHSLGSVVAYETLCALAGGHRVRAFVTLGSPLGIPRLILHRLRPMRSGQAPPWPGGAGLTWTNVVDRGDVVALHKDLDASFGRPPDLTVHGRSVHNGSHAHDALAYLCAVETGTAIAGGLG